MIFSGLRRRRAGTDIAVVVPLFNHARYVAAALRSVLAQSAAPREILVLDDGSSDDGAEMARAALREVPAARVLRQPNAGAHAAINRAVELTDAPYIAVLNSDDLFAPQKLAWCQELLARAELVCGRVALIGPRGGKLSRGPAADWLRRAERFAAPPPLALLHENFVATTSNMVFSRALWRRLGGFAPLRTCHDLDFLLRAYDAGGVLLDRARVHALYRVHPENTVHRDEALLRLEVAAVTAATFCQSGAGLSASEAYAEMLRTKPYAGLVTELTALFPTFADRTAFYAFVTAPENRARFAARV